MTTTIPGFSSDTYADVHPGAWLIDPAARRCLACNFWVPSGLFDSHPAECLAAEDEGDPVLPDCETFDLAPRDDRGSFPDGSCAFCGATEDVSVEVDPFAADVYNDQTEVLICGPCVSDRTDDI